MQNSLLTRVKSKLFLPTQRRSLSILEGEYQSLAFGRSTDFEDLREYEAGDDIKDIDWKATARSSTPLTRRYIASRRHTVLLVADTGRNMLAISPSSEIKNSLVILALGVIGYLSVRHTDLVAAVYGDAESTLTIPAKSTDSHLERILQAINHKSTQQDSKPSDIMNQLRHISVHYPQRMIVIVAADEFEPTEENLDILRRLRKRHDLMWISISDADPISTLTQEKPVFDILDWYEVPDFVKKDKDLAQVFADAEMQRRQEMKFALDGLRIPQVELDGSASTIGKLIALLERRRKQRGI